MKKQFVHFQWVAATLFLILFNVSHASAQQTVTHDFHETPLIEALQTISHGQSDYTIDILADGLDDLQTSARVKDLTVPDAIKKICKGQPVKVKVQGQTISVQATKKQLQLPDRIRLVGEVRDGFLDMPLPQANVSMHAADSTVLVDSLTITQVFGAGMRVKNAHFMVNVKPERKEYLFRARLDGYDDVWQRAAVTNPWKDEVEVPTLQMFRMRNVTLDEVTVTATKIKFFYRGDTLIYDATAFRMPEGSMLDDLIRQLPGVTMNDDGEIFVNGRKVDELLLGSHTFFGGNKRVLMQNLPYYTVKHLKVYEKQTDMSEALGYDVEPRKYVMDVNLKEEYSRGYIGNVEAAAGTEGRWLGRAFALGFTDRTRLTLLANANNVGETRHIGQSGHWTPASMPRSLITTRSAAAEISYYAKGDKLSDTFRAEYTSTTDEQTMHQRSEQFLAGSTPTSLTESFSRQGSGQLRISNNLTLKKPTWIYSNAEFSYARRDGRASSAFEQWDDTLTATLRSVGISKGTNLRGQLDVQGAFNVGEGQRMTFYTFWNHSQEKAQQSAAYEQRLSPQGDIVNADDISNQNTWGVANLSYQKELGGSYHVMFGGDLIGYTSERSHDYLYHPDTLMLASQIDALAAITDTRNSYDSHREQVQNSLGASFWKSDTYRYSDDLPYTISYNRFRTGFSVPVRRERLAYRRGALDTLATQTTVYLNASVDYRIVKNYGRHDIRLSASHDRSAPMLMDRITYRDDSRPLVVKLGNPALKGRVTTKLKADFNDGNTGNSEHPQSYHVGASFDYRHRDVAQAVTYAPQTGVFTYQPMNIGGAYTAGATFDYTNVLGEQRSWTVQTNADANLHHDKDYTRLEGETESQLSTVNTLTLHDGAYIQYERGALNLRATGDISWRRSEGRMRDFATLSALDYRYGLTARYTLPRLGTTLATDATMYSRRGYGSAELNTDDFLVNASVSQPLLKGKLIVRLEAFDLLQQLTATQYVVTAQGRTETLYRSLPHYVMLHTVWHFNHNPKTR
jgi:hypothetical protein